jgi:hypothetical protein
MKDFMRSLATFTAQLAIASLLVPGGGDVAAQEPAEPAPVEGARPLTLPRLRPPVADTGIFSPLPLPSPNEIRRPNGSPGREYWQQRVDYRIRATLDTTAKQISGTASILYTNNSPDSLHFVWLQLDQNLFRSGSTGSLLFPSEGSLVGAEFEGGFEIDSVMQCSGPDAQPGRSGAAAQRRRRARVPVQPRCQSAPLETRVDDTMMYVELGSAIPAGGNTALELSYRFTIPERGADRMGRDGGLYQVAQWYPRLAVYDDVHGWNTDQYLGQGEFYLEYGNIEYEVTVPAGYIVAGTGVLQNPGDVLTSQQRRRLAAAVKSDTTVGIITGQELESGAARSVTNGSLTWRFKAERVRDAAWSASPEYLWDATAWEGILVHSYYRPAARDIWRDAAQMGRASIQEYSTHWFSYPYPQISIAEGPVPGMEYPMLVLAAQASTSADLSNVLSHEIGHMWYPMLVGSDERRHPWMDEGFTTFINALSEQNDWKLDDAAARQRERQLVIETDQLPTAQPILTPASRYRTSGNLLSLTHVKPSIVLLTLRSKVVGAQAFDGAFREYTRRWAFKHPTPADFFRTIEELTGRDLAWFWRSFFYTTAALDQSVESVKQDSAGTSQVVLVNLGDAVMPVELELGFEDGTTELVRLPVEIWYAGNRYVYKVTIGKSVVSARVNPDGTFPDAAPGNDAWKRPAATATPTP